MLWENWQPRWEATLESCKNLGGKTRELVIAAPASLDRIKDTEARLELSIPKSFKLVLTQFSSKVNFSWFLSGDIRPPDPLRETLYGGCWWDLSSLYDIEIGRRDWVQKVFPNPDDPYDKVWHQKLAFHPVANGDYLALDLSIPDEAPVVYLSHDDGEGHGYVLGQNFIDFIERWSLLGCPGAEDWQWLPFVNSPTSGIDPNCENALKWRDWFKLEF